MRELPQGPAPLGAPRVYGDQSPGFVALVSEGHCPAGWALALAQYPDGPWGVCSACAAAWRVRGGKLWRMTVDVPSAAAPGGVLGQDASTGAVYTWSPAGAALKSPGEVTVAPGEAMATMNADGSITVTRGSLFVYDSSGQAYSVSTARGPAADRVAADEPWGGHIRPDVFQPRWYMDRIADPPGP